MSVCSDAFEAPIWRMLLQDGIGFPSADFLTLFLVLGVGLPALLQTLRDCP